MSFNFCELVDLSCFNFGFLNDCITKSETLPKYFKITFLIHSIK